MNRLDTLRIAVFAAATFAVIFAENEESNPQLMALAFAALAFLCVVNVAVRALSDKDLPLMNTSSHDETESQDNVFGETETSPSMLLANIRDETAPVRN